MKILRYIKVLLICGPVIIFYHFRYTRRFLKHPERYSLEYKYQKIRKEIVFVIKRFKIDFIAHNYEPVANLKEKSLIISNHLSDLDPLFIIAMSEKPITFIAKKEMFDFPFVGKAAKVIEAFSLDRQNIMNQIKQIKDVVTYLKDPTKPSVIVFIEGTRNKHPENPCLEFHAGTLKIAQMANVPLVITSLYGTFRVLDKKSYLRKFPVFASYIKTIEADRVKTLNTVELAESLKKEIDAEVDLLRADDKKYILDSKNCKRRKASEILVDARANS